MTRQRNIAFASVPDTDNAFLALFPHRFDYIWAPYPDGCTSVEWKTESRHPLSDRLIQQASYLYGVRFGAQTQYCLLDIDMGSPYHPQQDAFAISRILLAMEPLGFHTYVACTSSYSGGLHLYFPFAHPQSSWKLAIAVSTVLENAGFKIKPGQLEVFPDPKPYRVDGKQSLFNAHRLPLQIGSYLVDGSFQPVWSDHQLFVQQWQLAKLKNDVDAELISVLIKQIKRNQYFVSTKADKFINDLNAEIELGWTDYGQTNYLLGRITMREYIFRHILSGGTPLEGAPLVQAIVSVAEALPGYQEWCRHRHEIHHRAEEWARCIEQSHYFHYGDAAGKFQAKSPNSDSQPSELIVAVEQAPSWNQQQSTSARDRIRHAIALLLEQDRLPAAPTARFHALVQCGIGGGTLYRHRDLWHPHYFQLDPVEFPPHPPTAPMDNAWDCCEAASHANNPSSLFPGSGGNSSPDGISEDWLMNPSLSGRNSELTSEVCSPLMTVFSQLQVPDSMPQITLPTIAERQQLQEQRWHTRQINRMQRFLESGDPILMAEAIAWSRAHPGTLISNS